MKTPATSRAFLCAWLLCFGLLAPAARAQGLLNLAERLPGNASLAVLSGDIGATCAEFQATTLGETLGGPAFDPLIEALQQQKLGGPLNLRPLVGFDWSELEELHAPAALVIFETPQGEPALAWIFGGTASQEPSAPLVAATRYFAAAGYRASSAQRGEVGMTMFMPPPARGDEQPRVLFAAREFYGIADSPDAAAALLAVNRESSLASSELWQQTQPQGPVAEPRPGDVTLLVRPFELWELARKGNPPAEGEAPEYPDDPDSLASSRQVGFDDVRAIVGRVSFPAEANRDWQIAVNLVTNRPYEKAMRLLELRSGQPPQLPDYVAAGATSATYWRWDFPIAMQGFGNLFDEANEPGPDGVGLFTDMLDGLRDDPEGVQVDLRREVFENLGPGIWNLTDLAGPQTEAQPNGERTLYIAEVRDVPAVADALKRFYRGDDRVSYERSAAYDIWTVPEGASLFVEGESDSVVTIRALALGEDRMLFGTDVDFLRETLAGGASDRLNQDTDWLALWQGLQARAGEAALWGLSRLDDTLAPAYQQATAEKLDEEAGAIARLWRVLLFGIAAEDTALPVAQAPPFDQVRPALGRGSTLLEPAGDNWTVTITGQRRKD